MDVSLGVIGNPVVIVVVEDVKVAGEVKTSKADPTLVGDEDDDDVRNDGDVNDIVIAGVASVVDPVLILPALVPVRTNTVEVVPFGKIWEVLLSRFFAICWTSRPYVVTE